MWPAVSLTMKKCNIEGFISEDRYMKTLSSRATLKKDLKFSVLCTEENWFKRGVKEAIAIKKTKPTLNKDQGRYHLSAIYDDFIRTSLTMSTTRTGEKDGTEETNF